MINRKSWKNQHGIIALVFSYGSFAGKIHRTSWRKDNYEKSFNFGTLRRDVFLVKNHDYLGNGKEHTLGDPWH